MRIALIEEVERRKQADLQKVEDITVHLGTISNLDARSAAADKWDFDCGPHCQRDLSMEHWKCTTDWCACECHSISPYAFGGQYCDGVD
jgi:hypothetical protein